MPGGGACARHALDKTRGDSTRAAHLLVLRSSLADLSDDLLLLHLKLGALALQVADRPVDLPLVLLQLLRRRERLGEEERHTANSRAPPSTAPTQPTPTQTRLDASPPLLRPCPAARPTPTHAHALLRAAKKAPPLPAPGAPPPLAVRGLALTLCDSVLLLLLP